MLTTYKIIPVAPASENMLKVSNILANRNQDSSPSSIESSTSVSDKHNRKQLKTDSAFLERLRDLMKATHLRRKSGSLRADNLRAKFKDLSIVFRFCEAVLVFFFCFV